MIAWVMGLAVPALVSWAVIALLARSPWAARLADHPNERSLHLHPTPRLGGIGVAAGIAASATWRASPELSVAFACAGALAVVSLFDDRRSLPIHVRLPSHLLAAMGVVAMWWASWPQAAPIALAAGVVLAFVWMTNLYNFMDGADGLAGGMAVIGFSALAIAAARADEAPLAWACASIAAANLGFLAHNFPPARVFMGDAGAVPLGFLAAALGLHGWLAGAWPAWFAPLVFSPFIVDATVTILRRLLRGERIWKAHREHYYQRLVLAGWSKRSVAFGAYALMAAVAASALVGRESAATGQYAIIFVWAAAFGLLLLAIDRRAPRRGGGIAKLPDAGSGKE